MPLGIIIADMYVTRVKLPWLPDWSRLNDHASTIKSDGPSVIHKPQRSLGMDDHDMDRA